MHCARVEENIIRMQTKLGREALRIITVSYYR